MSPVEFEIKELQGVMDDRSISFEYRIEPGTIVVLVHCGTQVQVEVIEKRDDGLTFSGEVRGFTEGRDQEILPKSVRQLPAGAIVDFRREHVKYQIN